jgi:predicted nucleotidyltransferase
LQETRLIEPKKIREEIGSKLMEINEQSRNYIRDVILIINREKVIEKVLSIILFGSQMKNHSKNRESTVISDCDLLIVFKDNVSTSLLRKIEKYLIALENKHNFRRNNSNFVNKMLDVMQQTTGMFVSHFLTKKTYFESGIFHKIFSVNKFLSDIFAPKKLVLSSVVDNSTVLWGEDLRDLVKEKVEIDPYDMIKSITMNLLISLLCILFSPLKIFRPKYQLEAVKWSLRASNFYAFEDSPSLNYIIKRFIFIEKSQRNKYRANRFYAKFLELRNNPHINFAFMLRCPFRIIKIHLKGIWFKKIKIKMRKRLKSI